MMPGQSLSIRVGDSPPFRPYVRRLKKLVALSALGEGFGGTLAEMYVQGVSTRKVKAVTEALCGHSFSASSISAINKSLDESLRAFSERRLADPFPYLILDAHYERIREGGVIVSQAVLVAVAVDWEGRRQSSPWSLPTARAGRAGATSCLA